MRYARIEDSVVAEIIDVGDKDINEMFTAELVATMIQDISNEAIQGSGWDGTNFNAPIPYVMGVDQIRELRNSKLTHSDWTQGSDSPLEDAKKTEWAVYRQSLRDLVASYPDITWPEVPE